jgi:hypothetical protein
MSAPTDYRALGKRGGLATAASRDMRIVAAHARKRSPQSLDYWRARVVEEYGALDASDCDQRAQARMRLHFAELGKKSAATRRKRAGKVLNATNGRPTDRTAAANTDHGYRRGLPAE